MDIHQELGHPDGMFSIPWSVVLAVREGEMRHVRGGQVRRRAMMARQLGPNPSAVARAKMTHEVKVPGSSGLLTMYVGPKGQRAVWLPGLRKTLNTRVF